MKVVEGAEVRGKGVYLLNLSPSLLLVGIQVSALAYLFKGRPLLSLGEKLQDRVAPDVAITKHFAIHTEAEAQECFQAI